MTKAIVTKFHGPTNSKGSRYSATDNDGNTAYIDADQSRSDEQNHQAACQELCDRMRWYGPRFGTYYGGYLLRNGKSGHMVWVSTAGAPTFFK